MDKHFGGMMTNQSKTAKGMMSTLKDTQTFGAKMKMAWDQIIAQPFNEWWNSTGKAWFADKASKIGNGIGSTITFGILALLGVDVKGAAADGASIGASFAEGFKVGFDGRKVGEGILDAIKGVFKDAGTLFPGGKEASSTSWISAGLLTLMGIKGSKVIGSVIKGSKHLYNFGKRILKGLIKRMRGY